MHETPRGCIAPERIEDTLGLPVDHADRRHLDDCPRCGALTAAYTAFMSAEGVAGAHPEDAERRLAAFRETLVRDSIGPGAPVSPVALPLPQRRWYRHPVFAVAALVVVSAFVLWPRVDSPADRVLRGDGRSAFVIESAVGTIDGVSIFWSAVTDADAYEVRVYSDSMGELYRERTAATELHISATSLGAPGLDTVLIVRVHAATSGDPVDVTAPVTVTIR